MCASQGLRDAYKHALLVPGVRCASWPGHLRLTAAGPGARLRCTAAVLDMHAYAGCHQQGGAFSSGCARHPPQLGHAAGVGRSLLEGQQGSQ